MLNSLLCTWLRLVSISKQDRSYYQEYFKTLISIKDFDLTSRSLLKVIVQISREFNSVLVPKVRGSKMRGSFR